ncbi:MAG: sigma-54 dependent transcriptional regulator [Planctomycetia bacterium]|nr:sigma-54 dependent transcriptional regulator [Planctomycetia bacterium]
MSSPVISLLIVDNERPHAEIVAMALDRVGYHTEIAVSGEEAVAKIQDGRYDVIFTDLIMDNIDGFGVLKSARECLPDAAVILMTGHGSVPSAVRAMQQGAFNYLLKPLDLKQLRAVAEKAAESAVLKRTNVELQTRLDEKFGFEKLIGNSPEMMELVEKLRRIAPTNATVLIQGATGTGKELVAQAIHQNSPRKNKPFVGLNCAALSENILESELFGHVKGAFTDATSDRVGKIEYANGGTLFLDEVGDMPLPTQIKLLRVLEDSEITRVGANTPIKVNVRLLSATNRDLVSAIESGSFRSDLYHRLKVVSLKLPTVSERSGDIPVLIDHFIQTFAKKHGKPIRGMTGPARKCFLRYGFPGNVRELRNLVESMVVVDYDGLLDIDDLPEELEGLVTDAEREQFRVGNPVPLPPPEKREETPPQSSLQSYLGKTLDDLDTDFIRQTLEYVHGNREEAARLLGISERTLYRKLKDHS